MTLNFEELLFETPDCNDFRKLSNGDWIAYSTRLDETGDVIRATGSSIRDALEKLHAKLK